MIRREDGSYSRRGLWDNIRDNRGSGKEPTKEMLEQERKIKANKKEMGGYMYAEGGINNPGFRALPDYVQEKIMDNMYREGGINNPGFKALPDYVQDKIMANMYQEGGMEPEADPQQEEQLQAIMQQVAQMLQQGAQPEEILQMLIEAGVPEDQATQMVQAAMQQMQEPQDTPQMRDGGIPERYKKMGFGKVGAKKQSTRPGKKWMVLAKKGDQYKIVHGGDDNMKDFSQHGSEDRKENFWNRMGGRDSAKANDPFSPLYWHKKFGTWQEGGEIMDEQMEGENEGMGNESAMLEQIESQVEEALKQGADPEEVLQQLIQMGVPEEQAVQMIQEILGEIQGGETESEAPEMENGGYYLNALKGKTIKDYTFNSKTGKYEVSYE
jgi:transcriptional regulator CtsR